MNSSRILTSYLDDEAVKVKIVLNTKGTVGEIGDELKAMLRYMDGLPPESAYTKELDSAVADVRADVKWRVEYMRLMERDREKIRLGEYKGRVSMVRELRNQTSKQTLIKICYDNPELLQTIFDAIDANPDWDDEQIAEHVFL